MDETLFSNQPAPEMKDELFSDQPAPKLNMDSVSPPLPQDVTDPTNPHNAAKEDSPSPYSI